MERSHLRCQVSPGKAMVFEIWKFRLDNLFLDCEWHPCENKRPRCPVAEPLGFAGRSSGQDESEGARRAGALFSSVTIAPGISSGYSILGPVFNPSMWNVYISWWFSLQIPLLDSGRRSLNHWTLTGKEGPHLLSSKIVPTRAWRMGISM